MSEATLLNMLKISPFSYGLVISKVRESEYQVDYF